MLREYELYVNYSIRAGAGLPWLRLRVRKAENLRWSWKHLGFNVVAS